jgi:hypothetical protein
MASLKRQITEAEKQQVLAQQRRNGALYCFVDDHPIENERDVEFHHIKPFSEDGPSETGNIGAVCKEHHRRIRTLSLSEFRDQLAMARYFEHPAPRRLDDLLEFKLSSKGFGRQVSYDGDLHSQITLHFTDPERSPQTCSVFSCSATGMHYFYSVLPIEYICNDTELLHWNRSASGNCTDTLRRILSLPRRFADLLHVTLCCSTANTSLQRRYGRAEECSIARCTSILMFGC